MSFVRSTPLPFSRPSINQEDIDGVVDVLKSGWITTGPRCAAFEAAFREYLGAEHACALTSATAGMHLVLSALGIGPGDEVVTPSMTWSSTVNLITLLGARPVFADIDRRTLMVTPESVENVLTPRVRAIIPVHFAGAPIDLTAFRKLAADRGVALVEDAAHALGTECRGERIGRRGTAIFSFHPIKNITTGEGGMVVSDDRELIEKVKLLKFHGLARDAWQRYARMGALQDEVALPGFKYNLTDIQASLGITQLKRLNELNRRRAFLAGLYDRRLAGIEGFDPIRPPSYPHLHSHHLYVVLLKLERLRLSRDEFLVELKKRNIGTGIHFRAVHTQYYYRECAGFGPGLLPETEWVSERIFSLPLYPDMTEGDVEDVAQALADTLAAARK